MNAMSFSHQCIKCKSSYSDEDPDPYYCEPCNAARLQVIKEMDGKYNTVGQQPGGMLAAYDQARQGRKFPRASALGL